MAGDDERDDRDGGEQEPEPGFYLDLDAEEDDVDRVTREALEALERERPVEQGESPAPHGELLATARPRGAGDEDDAEGEAMTIARLEEELAELRDRSIRTLADFDNFRKRAERERDELRRLTRSDMLRDFLPVLDNLERALSAGGSVEDLKLGVEMTLKQFRDLLRQHGVVAVESVGAPFDPNVHEAVVRDEDRDAEVPMVTEELQRGYTVQGRLLRPAMVRVAVPLEEGEE
ncbi:MAG TPA: nucleotide exchange factor GrpE [Thermoanaerobaculia bacterium]|nr:nucleotide exchange factor GrpE [Thermoanaerobaculia bacterium]